MDQPNTRLSIASGCFCILLGLIVVYGWNRQSLPVIQIHSSFAPMQYVTALGFLFCGISLVLSNFKKHFLACILGLLASLIGAVTLAQYICDVNTGLDELFIDPQVLANVSYPGRMAPNTALCFILSGLALSLRCLAQKIKKVVSETLTKYTPLLGKTNLILSLNNDADRLSDSNCEHNELSRRKAINKSLLWTKLIINDNVVCTTVKKNILYPGFHSEYKNDIRIRLNQMPSNVVLVLAFYFFALIALPLIWTKYTLGIFIPMK